MQSSVAILKTSGYSLLRSPSKYTMNIKADQFFGDHPVIILLHVIITTNINK